MTETRFTPTADQIIEVYSQFLKKEISAENIGRQFVEKYPEALHGSVVNIIYTMLGHRSGKLYSRPNITYSRALAAITSEFGEYQKGEGYSNNYYSFKKTYNKSIFLPRAVGEIAEKKRYYPTAEQIVIFYHEFLKKEKPIMQISKDLMPDYPDIKSHYTITEIINTVREYRSGKRKTRPNKIYKKALKIINKEFGEPKEDETDIPREGYPHYPIAQYAKSIDTTLSVEQKPTFMKFNFPKSEAVIIQIKFKPELLADIREIAEREGCLQQEAIVALLEGAVKEYKGINNTQQDAPKPTELQTINDNGVLGYYLIDIERYLGDDRGKFHEWNRDNMGGLLNGKYYVKKEDFDRYIHEKQNNRS